MTNKQVFFFIVGDCSFDKCVFTQGNTRGLYAPRLVGANLRDMKSQLVELGNACYLDGFKKFIASGREKFVFNDHVLGYEGGY